MLEYVVPGNIDDRILNRSSRILHQGGLLALPTDTSWSLVCSSASQEGIRRLRLLSGERDERHFTLLCSNISQFAEYCNIDNSRFRMVKRLSPGPYVFILRTLLGTEKALAVRRRELGVRIPGHPVPLALLENLGSPLYSVTAKRTMALEGGQEDYDNGEEGGGDLENSLPPIPEEALFDEGWELESIADLDLILDTSDERPRIFSTILDLTGDEVVLVRSGAGPWPV